VFSLWEAVRQIRSDFASQFGRNVGLPEACWLAGRIAVYVAKLPVREDDNAGTVVNDAERVFESVLRPYNVGDKAFHVARLFLRPMVTQALAAAYRAAKHGDKS